MRFFGWFRRPKGPSVQDRIIKALAELGGHGFTVDLWRHIDKDRPSVHIGALYVALENLVDCGYLVTAKAPGGPERGFREKRSFGLTDSGWRKARGGDTVGP